VVGRITKTLYPTHVLRIVVGRNEIVTQIKLEKKNILLLKNVIQIKYSINHIIIGV